MHTPARFAWAADDASVVAVSTPSWKHGRSGAKSSVTRALISTAMWLDWREAEMEKQHRTFRMIAALMAGLMIATSAPMTWAASHREAPLIALDPTADITDVYAFRSWEDPTKAVFIMNVIPSQVPASGPNFFNFDDEVVYALHLDLNADGDADDAIIEFRFHTALRVPFDDLPVSYAGVDPVP